MPKERTLMVRMSEKLHKSVRVKAAELGKPVSEIVRDLLEGWAEGKYILSESQEAQPKRKPKE